MLTALTPHVDHDHENLAGTITPICLSEEPLFIPASGATYRAWFARACWGQNEVLLTLQNYATPAIGTCPERQDKLPHRQFGKFYSGVSGNL